MGWIEISNLSKSYGKREVIHGLNLNIEKGINLIRGENGAGKSTLISIIERPKKKTSTTAKENAEFLVMADISMPVDV